MGKLARNGSQDIKIRHLAIHLCSNIQQKDYGKEACAVLAFVKNRIRYIRDMASAEVLQTPQVTMGVGAGDCDDKCILLAALLSSIGHRTRFIAIAQSPEVYSHVWTQSFINGEWLDLEPTEPIGCGDRVPETGIAGYLWREV